MNIREFIRILNEILLKNYKIKLSDYDKKRIRIFLKELCQNSETVNNNSQSKYDSEYY